MFIKQLNLLLFFLETSNFKYSFLLYILLIIEVIINKRYKRILIANKYKKLENNS